MVKYFLLWVLAWMCIGPINGQKAPKIDREKLVKRHNISHTEITPFSPLSVGNGKFVFTADITGLQTFPEHYEPGIPLGTQSDWGWHYPLNPRGYKLSDILKTYQVGDREVKYAWRHSMASDTFKAKASDWLRESPHRIHLGMIGLELKKKDQSLVRPEKSQTRAGSLDGPDKQYL